MNIEPTAHGFIRNAIDALLILEACLQGEFLHIPRTLRPEEARSAVHDGALFVYEVGSRRIHEWQDCRQWYPEFRLGDFTVCCEANTGATHQVGRLIKQTIVLYGVIEFITLGRTDLIEPMTTLNFLRFPATVSVQTTRENPTLLDRPSLF